MQSLDSMISKLKPLGIYSLKNDSTIFYELSAYAEGLEILENCLSELESECFVSTSSSFGLETREKLFCYNKTSDSNIDLRRNLISYLLSVGSNDYNKESITKAIIASGIDGFIVEQPGENVVYINCSSLKDNFNTKAEAENIVKQFLPAHIKPIFDFRIITWDYIKTKDKTFDEFDSKDLTWNSIDNYEEE